MKPSKLAVETVEETLRGFFGERHELDLAYLFGSYLNKGNVTFRDIDIAVHVIPQQLEVLDQEKPFGYGAHLASQLCRLLECDLVDLVILNRAPPLLLRQVIGKGKLIFCSSEADRIRFEMRSLKRHADTAHLRRIKRFYMKQRIEKGLPAYV